MNRFGKLALALLVCLAPAVARAQQGGLPAIELPPGTVIGNTQPVTAFGEAIPFSVLGPLVLQNGIPLTTGSILVGGAANVAVPQVVSGDCALSFSGVMICTKSNGTPFAIVATSGSASDLSVGTLPVARLPAGVDANILNAQTANYSLATTDCGKTVTLGGSAFFTLTVGAASGFPATCTVVVVNIDSGRGKKMTINGVTFPNNSILWPLQSFTLKNENNAWVVVNMPGRWKLTTSVQFEVNSGAADDTSDGLATGTSNAFKTINGAFSVLATAIDANNNGVKLHTNCSGVVTYTGQVKFLPIVGQSFGNDPGQTTPILSGDTATPTNCILTSASGATVAAVGNVAWNIEGFQLKNTDGSSPCMLVDDHSTVRAGVLDYNSCNGASGNQIVVENFSLYKAFANYTISAGAASHVLTTLMGDFLQGNIAVTCTSAPAFPNGFAFTNKNSFQYWGGANFAACTTATGPRYAASTGGGIDTNGGGATFLPGNAAGTAANPGWYN